MKFSLGHNEDSIVVSASAAPSGRLDGTGVTTGSILPEGLFCGASAANDRDPQCASAIISRRDFMVASTAGLVVSTLGLSRASQGAAPKLKIGFIMPESGPLAGEAASLFSGFQLFMNEHKTDAAGFEVLKRDSGPEDQKTLEALADLVMNQEVHILVSPPTLGGSEKAVHAVSGAKILLLVTNPSVRLVGGELCMPGSFRVCANNYQAAYPLASWALRNVGKKIFVTGQDDEQGNEQADYFALGFDKAGGAFGDRVMLSEGFGKVQTIVEGIRKSDSNLVFAAFRGAAAAEFLKAMRGASGSSGVPIVGPDSLTQFPQTASLAGEACKGIRTLTTLADPMTLVDRVKKSTGAAVVSAVRAAEGYDIGTIALHLAPQADRWTTDFPNIASSLEAFEFTGPRGTITFDLNHEIVVATMVQTLNMQGGRPSQEILTQLGLSRTPDFGCGRIGFPKKPETEAVEDEPIWEEKDE